MAIGNHIAQLILSRLGNQRKLREGQQTIPLEELESLARDYLKLTGKNATLRFGLMGPYYVTEDAALEFGAVARIRDDKLAHRELTARMWHAAPIDDRNGWRVHDAKWDITARTEVLATPGGPLNLVVKTNTRPRNR